MKLYTFSLVVFFFKLHSIDEYFERQQKSIVILLQSFFLFAMSIFNLKITNLTEYTQRIALQKYLMCLKLLPGIHQIIKMVK